MDYLAMNVNALKAELRKRGAKISGLKEQLIQRLQDYDRNNNFVGNVEENIILQNDSVYTVEWPSDSLYGSVTTKSESPDLDIVNITTYCLEVYADNVGMTEYAAVHRKGYNMMINEYLMALVTCTKNAVLFYRGQVHSENTKSLSYFVNIAIETDGKVVQSMCGCAAGKGPKAVCKHIACVFYAILRYKEHSEWLIKKTPTQNKQKWHEPKKRKLNSSPIKAENLKFEIQEYNVTKRNRTNLCFDPRSDNTCSAEEWNDIVRNRVINYCSLEKNRFGICGVFEVASLHGISNDHDYLKLPILVQYVLNRITVSPEEASVIYEKTKQQSQNKKWHSERSLRVTGSHVFNICKFTDRRDKVKYAEDILFPKQFKSHATEWGNSKEKTAIEAYESIEVESTSFLGFIVDRHCNWKTHVENLCSKLDKFVYVLRRLCQTSDMKTALIAYQGYVSSLLRYGIILWGNSVFAYKVFIKQKACLRALCGLQPLDTCKPLFKKHHILPLPCQYIYELLLLVKKNPSYFKSYNELVEVRSRRAQRRNKLIVPPKRLQMFGKSTHYMAITMYNKLPDSYKSSTLNVFKRKAHDLLINKCYYKISEFLCDNLK